MLIPEGYHLFVVKLHYTHGFDAVEPFLDAHMAFIADCRRDGFILVAGAQAPRTGGLIVAIAQSRTAVEERMADDPFVVNDVVSLDVTEFKPGTLHPALSDL